jgi:hypothetical protein
MKKSFKHNFKIKLLIVSFFLSSLVGFAQKLDDEVVKYKLSKQAKKFGRFMGSEVSQDGSEIYSFYLYNGSKKGGTPQPMFEVITFDNRGKLKGVDNIPFTGLGKYKLQDNEADPEYDLSAFSEDLETGNKYMEFVLPTVSRKLPFYVRKLSISEEEGTYWFKKTGDPIALNESMTPYMAYPIDSRVPAYYSMMQPNMGGSNMLISNKKKGAFRDQPLGIAKIGEKVLFVGQPQAEGGQIFIGLYDTEKMDFAVSGKHDIAPYKRLVPLKEMIDKKNRTAHMLMKGTKADGEVDLVKFNIPFSGTSVTFEGIAEGLKSFESIDFKSLFEVEDKPFIANFVKNGRELKGIQVLSGGDNPFNQMFTIDELSAMATDIKGPVKKTNYDRKDTKGEVYDVKEAANGDILVSGRIVVPGAAIGFAAAKLPSTDLFVMILDGKTGKLKKHFIIEPLKRNKDMVYFYNGGRIIQNGSHVAVAYSVHYTDEGKYMMDGLGSKNPGGYGKVDDRKYAGELPTRAIVAKIDPVKMSVSNSYQVDKKMRSPINDIILTSDGRLFLDNIEYPSKKTSKIVLQ